jgi:hypothetical protein
MNDNGICGIDVENNKTWVNVNCNETHILEVNIGIRFIFITDER